MRVVEAYADLLEDELNVKKVRVLDTASEAVAYSLNPLPKQLGQKYGSKFPAIRKALLEMDAESAAKKLLAGQPLEVQVEGETLTILPEEVEVRATAREGFAVASEGAYLAALITDLTPELVKEGLAREFVRRVQDLRKQADLEISDRIRLYYTATPLLAEAVKDFTDYIQTETLCVEMVNSLPDENLPTTQDRFDDQEVTISLKRVER
ncbi:MAG: DUF5915 domain-containing protein [Bellilinea sp.]|nr:DUF5915 domain-containing protein [Bellilinea sp.]